MGIQRGVSIYSYQENYYLRKMSFEDCIRAVSETGAKGVELIAEMHCPKEYRDPSPDFVARWHDWMAKYGTKPAALDVFLDYKLYDNRMLTEREMVAFFKNNFDFAKKLGFPVIRGMIAVPLPILRDIIPILEDYGLTYGTELHAPISPWGSKMQGIFELIDRTGTKNMGFIPDMSMWCKTAPRLVTGEYLRKGADPEIVERICQRYDERVPQDEVNAEALRMGAGPLELAAMHNVFSHARYDGTEWLREYADKVVHVHGKVYEMDENCEEKYIDYEPVVRILQEAGFDGWICTEYEGQRSYHDPLYGPGGADEVEQVRRHQVQLKRLLGA